MSQHASPAPSLACHSGHTLHSRLLQGGTHLHSHVDGGNTWHSLSQAARQQLAGDFPSLRVPQARPLSPGEVPCLSF